MLGKLIKHELRATSRVMLPLMAAEIIMAPLSAWIISSLDTKSFEGVLKYAGSAFLTLFFTVIAATFIAALVIMVTRFYRNLLGDEAYLTFTLPVSISNLIFSKLAVSFIWFAAVGIVCMLVTGIMIPIDYSLLASAFEWAERILSELNTLVGTGNIVSYILEAIVCAFLISCTICLRFYSALSLGHCFTGRKLFLSLCFYVLMGILAVILAVSILGSDIISSLNAILDTWLDTLQDDRKIQLIPHILMLGTGTVFAVIDTVLFLITALPLKLHKNIG